MKLDSNLDAKKYSATGNLAANKITFQKRLDVASIYFSYTSSATVGNRAPRIQLIDTDGSTVIAEWAVGLTQAASLTSKYSGFDGAVLSTSLFSTDLALFPIPFISISNGMSIKLIDRAAVDAADTATLYVLGNEPAGA